MNRTDHLLWNIAEECSEVAQRASKAARFGLDEIQPGQPYTNAQRIIQEYADLVGVLSLLRKEGLLNFGPDFDLLVTKKENRFEEYLKISDKQGRLD